MLPLSGQNLENYVIDLRRDFHRHPELSGEEKRTSLIVQKELGKLGISYKSGYGGYGVLGVIDGSNSGPTIALRADMDALPIKEMNSEIYSIIDGKMHACGHDAHTAMLLGSAHYLMERKNQIHGKVLLIFQPSEEFPPVGGAKPMMDDGVFEKYQPDVIFAQHIWPKLPVGQFGVRAGYMMGASDRFELIVEGKGGHASMPHQSIDAIIAVNQIINAIQTIISRNVDPVKEAVITIGTIKAGYRHNVIADRAIMEGTIRTFDSEIRKKIETRLREIVFHFSKAMGVNTELNLYFGYPPTVNDGTVANFVKQELVKLHGDNSCPDVLPSLGSEDFSRFLEKYKGVYYWLGVGGENGDYPPLHDPSFRIDERALKIGYESLAKIAISYGQSR